MREINEHSWTALDFQRGEVRAEGKTRNIILEIERIQLTRKRCRSHTQFCADCLTDADFIAAKEAALLFGTYPENLIRFMENNSSHYTKDADGAIVICVNSFLACINSSVNGSKLRLVG
jgi:hypothetical protein